MGQKNRTYIAIDIKSFYASVECVERGLDPLTTNLVVADASRTEKTICLAVSPSLKAYGIPGRARLFEVIQKVKEANRQRERAAPGRRLTGKTYDAKKLALAPKLAIFYLVATPRMAEYMRYSARIYQIYLKYVAPADIHVYSVDEVFIDVTNYLHSYKLTPRAMASMLIREVLKTTGITATAGIGTNLYLAKVAMDIQAKRATPDENGMRIAELDEMSYRRLLWTHTPLTDFWRVGGGYAAKLEANGLRTMGEVARCSLGKANERHNENLLYKIFGINAELLIDHAWGWEPCTLAEIKAYRPSSNSLSSGQVLSCPQTYDKVRLIVCEMVDLLALDLVEKGLVTDQLTLTIGYDVKNLQKPEGMTAYRGEIVTDNYGRKIPKHAHGTANLGQQTAAATLMMKAVVELFERIIDKTLLVRRINLAAGHLEREEAKRDGEEAEQLDLFTDYQQLREKRGNEKVRLEREHQAQKAILTLKKKYGKNTVLKGMNFEAGATTMSRNKQIGGHKA